MAIAASGADESRNPVLGIAMVLVAVFFFAGMDVATKYLTQSYNVPMVLAFRYAISLVLMAVFLWPRHGRALITWHKPRLVFLRSAAMVVASLCAAFAMQILPVAETVAIVYLAPIAVLLLAGPVLGEKVSLASWLAALGGFAGLLLIVRPGGGLVPVGVGFALAAAAVATWYYLFTRMLAASESTLALLFAANLAGTVTFGAALPWTLQGPLPSATQIALFLAAGSIAVIGHFLLTAAYREATAALLSPLNYVHLLWAALLGWLVFGHVPEPLGIVGMGLIAACGGCLTIWTHIVGRRRLRPPT